MYLACSASLGCNASLVPPCHSDERSDEESAFLQGPVPLSRTASLPFSEFLRPCDTIPLRDHSCANYSSLSSWSFLFSCMRKTPARFSTYSRCKPTPGTTTTLSAS